jgi:pyruvate kinase
MSRQELFSKRTKIIATLGPASESVDVLRNMFLNGANVIRLNASHRPSPETLQSAVDLIRNTAKSVNKHIGIMLDLQGPKIRVGKIAGGKIVLQTGDSLVLTTDVVDGTVDRVSVSYKGLPNDVKPTELLYLDDGKIQLVVREVTGQDITCAILRGGELSNYKGINLPHTKIGMSALTEKDKLDAISGVKAGVDFIALSFVSEPADVLFLRHFLEEHGGHNIQIISKIERHQALNCIEGILDVTDAVMVARGDLGVEIDLPNVPKAQKMIIREANQRIKPVIVATQMLESMILSRTATRAEVSDVANAIYDKCDAIMLSGETAVGIDPANVIKVMAEICEATDSHMIHIKQTGPLKKHIFHTKTTATSICKAADQIAEENNARAIMAFTSSGNTSLIASKLNPIMPIISPTDDEAICRRMSLFKGVIPMMMPKTFKEIHRWTDMISQAVKEARSLGYITKGDALVVTAGIPIGESNGINSIRVITA